jgi:hypothetical protein
MTLVGRSKRSSTVTCFEVEISQCIRDSKIGVTEITSEMNISNERNGTRMY